MCIGLLPDPAICCNSINPFDHIDVAALNASQEVKDGGKQIKMIMKQYRVTEVSHCGPISWFDSSGKLLYQPNPNKENYKYKIVYEDEVQNTEVSTEFTWCFN